MNALETEHDLAQQVHDSAAAVSAAGGEVARLSKLPQRAERAWIVAERVGGDAISAENEYEEARRNLKRAEVRATARKQAADAAVEELKQHRLDHVDQLLVGREQLTARAADSLARAEAAIAEAANDWAMASAAWGDLREGLRRRAMATGVDPADGALKVPPFPISRDPLTAFNTPAMRIPRPPVLTPGATFDDVIDMRLDIGRAREAVAAGSAPAGG